MKRLYSVLAIASGLLFLGGCGSDEIPDDEAFAFEKERAKAGDRPAKTVEQVAVDELFYKEVDNYFLDSPKDASPDKARGLNMMAVAKDGPTNPLAVPVWQLLDKKHPEAELRYPLQTKAEVLGQNSWMVWCGGNERFWDWLAGTSGLVDLLKVIDSRERSTRFDTAGMINEPYMTEARTPDEFGLWLDQPTKPEQQKLRGSYLKFAASQLDKPPFERGSAANRDGKEPYPYEDPYESDLPPPEIYGLSTGVVGLRLFPNPYFDEKAKKKWDPEKYFEEEDYYKDPDLVRPYRIGMSCAFCHASWQPLNPPRDKNTPEWANISSNIGAQYLRIRAVFGNLLEEENFAYHLIDSQTPGTVDTSLLPSDNVNNTNTMNSVFNLPQRTLLSFQNPKETVTKTSATQPNIWGNPKEFYKEGYEPSYDGYDVPPYKPDEDKVPEDYWNLFESLGLQEELKNSNDLDRPVPRILLDGSDSIGSWGALARVYLNIGTYSEQWERINTLLIGFTPQSKFAIDDLNNHSAYWHATQLRVGPMRDFFLQSTPPMPLAAVEMDEKRVLDKPINRAMIRLKAKNSGADPEKELAKERAQHIDKTKLALGRKAFAKNCIICHSSIQPETFFFPELPADASDEDKKSREKHELARAKVLLGDPDLGFVGNYTDLAKRRAEDLQAGADKGEFWYHDPGRWLDDPKYQTWAEQVVEKEEFWRMNYLSNDYRIPITLVKSSPARAMGTNALQGNMWSDFASVSYQGMPSVGSMEYFNPYKAEDSNSDKPVKYGDFNDRFTPRQIPRNQDEVGPGGGGPGFYRVPTLVSIWTTAPLLHNNSLGINHEDLDYPIYTTEGRLQAFDDAMQKLLWPEKRFESNSYNKEYTEAFFDGDERKRLEKDHGLIWRTPQDTYLELSAKQVPAGVSLIPVVMEFQKKVAKWFPWLEELRNLWFPSAVLILFALLLLYLPREKSVLLLGIGSLVIVAIALWAIFFGDSYPGLKKYYPILGPLALLIVATFLLLWSPREKAFKFLVFGLVGVLLLWIATFVWDHQLSELRPWLYSAVVVILVGMFFLWLSRKDHARNIAYVYLFVAVFGGLALYFFNGQLGGLRIGPIPAGTPVSLLGSANPDATRGEMTKAVKTALKALGEIERKTRGLDEEEATEITRKIMREKVAPALMPINKSPDFVMDKGHYYPWFEKMSDDEKLALIELLKTF